MYEVRKTMEIAVAHNLDLPYQSKCTNVHGHNLKVTVICRVKDDRLENGMVVDFSKIKEVVNQYDHSNLNHFLEQPTAENLAKLILEQIPHCARVEVEETEGNKAIYEPVYE